MPHGLAVDIFGPKKTIKWSQLWRNWVQQFLKDHSWFAYFPHSTRNISGIYSVMNNDDGLHGVSVDILKPTSIDCVKSTLAQLSDIISEGSLLIIINLLWYSCFPPIMRNQWDLLSCFDKTEVMWSLMTDSNSSETESFVALH